MRTKTLTVVAMALLLAASCAQPGGDSEGVALRYGFDAGDSYRYDNDFSMEMTADLSGLPADEAPDGPVTLDMDAAMTTTYTVADGAEPGTFSVAFGYEELSDFAMRVTGDGEEVTMTEADLGADLDAAPLPGGLTFVVDESGNILSVSVAGTDLQLPTFGSGMTGMAGFGSDMPFLGPELPDHPVAVGDTWTGGWTREVFPGTEVELTTQNRLVGVETVDGVEVHVIETTTASTPITLDLAELMGAFAGDELGAPPEGFGLEVTMSTAPSRSTVWFDAARGITMRQEFSGSVDMTTSITAEGQTGTVSMHMTMSGSLDLRP